MSLVDSFNIGAQLKAVMGSTNVVLSQTSAAAASAVDGLTIDRTALGRRYYSAKAIAAFQYLAASSQTVATLAISFSHSSDGTSWDAYSTATNPTAVQFGTTAGGTTDYDTIEQSVNLNGARRYLRVQIPAPTYANCSSGQGVFTGGSIIVFGGADIAPAQ